MPETTTPGRGEGVAAGLLFFAGTFQGAVPLVMGVVRDQHRGLLLALHLPAPWWWITSAAVLAAGWGGAVALRVRRRRPSRRTGRHRGSGQAQAPNPWSSVVFVAALTQGVVPLVSELLLDRAPVWALPARLASPWWWITAVGVILVAVVVLEALDRARRRGS